MAGWYARFIKNYAEMKLLINRLTFKGQKWEWGEEQETAFKNIKDALTRAPCSCAIGFYKAIYYTMRCEQFRVRCASRANFRGRRAPDYLCEPNIDAGGAELLDDGGVPRVALGD